MRKLVSWLFVSLDGVAENPGAWQPPDIFDDVMIAAISALTTNEDAMLLGRVSYQEWSGYWPTSTDEPFASHINGMPKYVVSTTLDDVSWGEFAKPTLISENVTDAIRALKDQPGKNVTVGGSLTLVRSLLRDGLLDELTLVIHPLVVGKGRRLFTDDDGPRRLQLVSSTVSGTGVVIATYRPVVD
jgi:dihydrofolate reductase